MSELGWVVASASLVLNLYLGLLLWRQAQMVESLDELRELIEESTDGKDNGSTFTR